MKSLIALPDDPAYMDWYVAIRTAKRRPTREVLAAAHELVAARYAEYSAAMRDGSLASLERDAAALMVSEQLRSCYKGPTKPLAKLKRAIADAQPKRRLKYCPMCGTGLPRTFDHYLPGVRFPEFSVHPLNLVPCCAECNSMKDDDWLSPEGRLQYLHAYSGVFPDQQFLKVTLHEDRSLPGVGATFHLLQPDGLSDDGWDLIEAHFGRLKLLDRYAEFSNVEVTEILVNCKAFLDAGGQDCAMFLAQVAADNREVYGVNHWIAVLMSAMAEHENLPVWANGE